MSARPLISASVLLLGGCSAISNFDFTFTDEDAGVVDAGDLDAGPRMDANGLDAGPGVDAGPPPESCPEPCVADALADFEGAQGAGAVDWRYHEDRREPIGVAYPELEAQTTPLVGFGSSASPAVRIASCADNAAAPECAGIEDRLLVQGDGPGSGADPAFTFEAPSRAVLRVQGNVRLPDGVSSAESHRVTVSRNARHDIAGGVTILPTTTPEGFDVLVDVLPGDRVIVTFDQRGGAEPVPLGVQLWVTRMGAPLEDRCRRGIRFEGDLRDECADRDVEDLATDGTAGSSQGPSVSAWLGMARELVEGQYLRPTDAPEDWSGDFTIQMWANNSSATPFDCSLWAGSTSDSPAGGISLSMNDDRADVRTFHPDDGRVCPDSGVPGVCYKGQSLGTVSQDEWHFWRLSRSTANDEILVCIDGVQRARLDVHGAINLTGAYPPSIGRNVIFNPAYYVGSFDDVRVYDVALPCER